MGHLTRNGGSELCFIVLLIVVNTEIAISTRLYSEGREFSYLYELAVTTKTENPTIFESQFNLTGKINIQCLKEHIIVQSKELTFSMFSGDSGNKKHTVTNKLPEEAVFLTKPFAIYFKDGKVSHMELSPEEPVWSSSIKQAWAGLLQLDVLKMDVQQANSFASLEDSIQGKCTVKYTVLPKGNGQALIVKFKSGSDCQSESSVWSNIDNVQCQDDEPKSHELFSRSEQKYEVIEDNERDSLIVKSIESFGETFIFVTENSKSTHSVTVRQKLTMQFADKVSKVIPIPASEILHKIESLKFDENEFFSFKFSTNEDLSKVVKKVVQLVVLITSQLEGANQLSAQANPQQSSLIPLLITYLRKLDADLLHFAFLEVKKLTAPSAEQLLIKIMPLVGSRESSLFILKLISTKQIDDFTAVFLLSAMPINIRQMSEELLIELEELNNLPENVSQLVKETAALSFGTLFYRACKTNKCSIETIHKYTSQYIDAINDNYNDFGKKLTHLAGLGNMRSLPSVEYLIPFVVGQDKCGEDFRIQVIKTVGLILSNYPKQAYDLFWPIVYNKNNSLEIKRAALVSLLKSKPSKSLFLQLQGLMETENDPNVYSLYFSLLKDYSLNERICNRTSYKIAQEVIQISQSPEISASTSFQQTFSIFGDNVLLTVLINSKSGLLETLTIDFTSNSFGYKVNVLTVYLKVRGLQEELIRGFGLNLPKEVRSTLVKLLTYNSKTEPLHLELILYAQRQAVFTRYYDQNNIHRLAKDINHVIHIKEINLSFFHATSVYNLEKFFVTDIGMPGVLSIDLPMLTSVEAKDDKEFTSFKLRHWSQGSTVLKVKNTIVSIWQGVMKSQLSRFNIPVNFKSTSELADQDIDIVQLMSPADNAEIGFKWQTNTNLFTVTYDEQYDALSESCIHCKNSITVFKEKATNEDLFKLNFKSYNLHSSVFDCENDGSMSHVLSNVQPYSTSIFKILGLVPSFGFYLQSSLARLPISGSCGFLAVLSPNIDQSQPKVCLGFKNVDYHSGENYFGKEFVVLFDTTDQEKCNFENNFNITMKFQEEMMNSATEVNNEECDLTADVKEWNCLKPVILECFSDTNKEPNIEKDLKLQVKLPKWTEKRNKLFSKEESKSGFEDENMAMSVRFEKDNINFKWETYSKTTYLSKDTKVAQFAKRLLLNIF